MEVYTNPRESQSRNTTVIRRCPPSPWELDLQDLKKNKYDPAGGIKDIYRSVEFRGIENALGALRGISGAMVVVDGYVRLLGRACASSPCRRYCRDSRSRMAGTYPGLNAGQLPRVGS